MTMMKTIGCLLAAAILLGVEAHPVNNAFNGGNHNNNQNNNNNNEEPACLVGIDNCRKPSYNGAYVNNVQICCVPGYFIQARNGACFCSSTESNNNFILERDDTNHNTHGVRPMTEEEKQAFKKRLIEIRKETEELKKRLKKEQEERQQYMKELHMRLKKEQEERDRKMKELQNRLRKEEEEREKRWQEQDRLRREREERNGHNDWWNWN